MRNNPLLVFLVMLAFSFIIMYILGSWGAASFNMKNWSNYNRGITATLLGFCIIASIVGYVNLINNDKR